MIKSVMLAAIITVVCGYFIYNDEVSVNNEKKVIAKQFKVDISQIKSVGYYPCLRDKNGSLTIYGQSYMVLNKKGKTSNFICDVKGVIHTT